MGDIHNFQSTGGKDFTESYLSIYGSDSYSSEYCEYRNNRSKGPYWLEVIITLTNEYQRDSDVW